MLASAPFPNTALAGERLTSLDFIRGVAVIAILAVNIFSFALPDGAALSPHWRGEQDGDTSAFIANYVFADGKFRGLFTLLFGAGMAMMMERHLAQGLPAKTLHMHRMIWLGVIGAAHMVLLWHGDILLGYALCGLLLTALPPHVSARHLIGVGTALLLGGAVMLAAMSLFSSPHMAAHLPFLRDNPAMMMDMIVRHDAELADLEKSVEADFTLYLGPYSGMVAQRIGFLFTYPAGFIMGALETIPLMLIGMGLYRSDFLTGRLGASAYWRVILISLPIGFALTALSLWPVMASDFDPLVGFAALISFSVAGRLALLLGYAALLILLARRWSGGFAARITAAGRMALSNYLGTSLIMTSLFYGYGLGLYGAFDRWALYGFVVLGAALMLLWSKLWLAHFHYGPAEWLWRSLARGEAQAFRRR
jgi:uncharacterized protein